MIPRLHLLVLTFAASLALAGCDTFGLDGGAGGAGPAEAAQGLDPRTDDLAALILALDLPAGVRPVTGGTVARFDASGTRGQKTVKASLVLADGSDVDGALPPPASGRSYVLFGFAGRDKAALRAAQAWVRSLPAGSAPVTGFTVTPKLCATGSVDVATATYSVVPALPGKPLLPLIANAPLQALAPGGALPPC